MRGKEFLLIPSRTVEVMAMVVECMVDSSSVVDGTTVVVLITEKSHIV